jgi:peptidoglycan/xylan/chitin deacetylase (PgdA/CDA1 family)
MKKKKIIRLILLIVLIIFIFLLFKFLNKKEKQQTHEIDQTEQVNSQEQNKDEEQEKATVPSKLEEKLASGKVLGENGFPVLMYHFFYDKSKDKGQDGNWIEISDFEEQIKYLAENDYYFPTWEEVEKYIDKEQELPEKSVVITVDDGDPSFFDLAVPVIQKYKVPVTSFVITYWYGNRAVNKQEYVDYQSHSYDMHKAGEKGKGVMLSWDYNKIKDDILLSSQVLGGANIFCYPFGQYNDLGIKVLKENGYKLAFTTQGGRVKKGASKYELPRVRISGNTSLSSFISKVQ